MSIKSDRKRLFGTDGLRGRYGEGWLVPESMAALGAAIGRVLAPDTGRSGQALLGHDGRRSGPDIETALAAGLRSAGYEVKSAGLITTPGLALLARLGQVDLAIMVSASHNPAEDNGIKIFDGRGEKVPDAAEDRIEQVFLDDPRSSAPPDERVVLDPELEGAYLAHLQEAFGDLKLDGRVLALDCANGGASRVAPRIFGRLGAQVIPIACSPDGDNINQDCGSTNPAALQEAVRLHGATMGIALDGDGDRCILVDEHGSLVNGDGILTLLARHAKERDRMADPRIVATVMSNRGLHRALRAVGVEVLTVGVGDRRVVEALRREELSLGGEQSGHVVFGGDHYYIGDGIYTALRTLSAMTESKLPLSDMAAPFTPFPQVLLNVAVSEKPSLGDFPAVVEAVRRIEQHWGEDGRVLLRYSGTEPLARVMVEGPDEALIRTQAQEVAGLIASEIGA